MSNILKHTNAILNLCEEFEIPHNSLKLLSTF